MKTPLKLAGAALLGAASLFAAAGAATAASDVYYVEFYDPFGNQIGLGQVGCADTPGEYILLWGSDQGEMVVVGQENCPALPPPFGW